MFNTQEVINTLNPSRAAAWQAAAGCRLARGIRSRHVSHVQYSEKLPSIVQSPGTKGSLVPISNNFVDERQEWRQLVKCPFIIIMI